MGEGMSSFLQGLGWNALEASALAVAVALITCRRKPGAAARHLLWLLVLVKLLLPPVLVDPLGLGNACAGAAEWLRVRPEPVSDGFAVAGTEEEFLAEAVEEFPFEDDAAAGDPAAPLPEVPPAAATAFVAAKTEDESGRFWTTFGAGAIGASWLAGALAMALLQGARIAAFRARLRSAVPAPGEVAAVCSSVARRIGLGRAPAVMVLSGLSTPLVWALSRPVIFIPPELSGPAFGGVLESVLAHELAHLRRRDPWISWLELAATFFYWWLPTLWWTRRALRRSADEACDAWAVSAVGSRRSYAESLVAAVEILKGAPTPVPAVGLGLGEREAMERRLTMVMRDRLSPRLSRPAFLLVVLTAVLALPATPLRLGAQAPRIGGQLATTDAEPPAPAPAKAKPAVISGTALPPPAADPAPQAEPAPKAAPAAAAEPAAQSEPPAASPVPAKGARPARARTARVADDTESRLESLERKMERILDELEALRTGPNVRATAPRAQVEIAPVGPRGRKAVRAVQEEDRVYQVPPRTGAVVAPAPVEEGWPAREVYVPKGAPNGITAANGDYVVAKSYRAPYPREKSLAFDTRRLPVNEEKRKQIEDINRMFDERLKSLLEEQKKAVKALTEEHRAAVKESLKDDLSSEELEDLDFGQRQTAPVPTPAKR